MESSHLSPDGALYFLVRSPDDDITMGFDGFPSHIRGSILAAVSSDNRNNATNRFIADLVGARVIIAIAKALGVARDIWVTDHPAEDLRYRPAEETIEFRLWDETQVRV